MRTLKKSLALVLALVMVLGLGVVGVSADNAIDNFTDASDIGDAYYEAVGVLTGLGIIDGMTDTTIAPTATYTREQAAKIIAYMVLGKTNADSLTCTKDPFDDVAADRWSAGYISFCQEQGIIDGMTDSTFEPTGTLTGFQWAKMLLSAVGFNHNGEFEGASWSLNTARVAHEAGLFNGDTSGADHVAISRQQAALYAFNVLTGLPQVTWTTNGNNYIFDITFGSGPNAGGYIWADGTGKTLGESTFGLDSETGIATRVEGQGYSTTAISDGYSFTNGDGTYAAGLDIDQLYHAVRVWYVPGTYTGETRVVFTYDLAKVTDYYCADAKAEADYAKLNGTANKFTVGNNVSGYQVYESNIIDNTAYARNSYALVDFLYALGTMGTKHVDGVDLGTSAPDLRVDYADVWTDITDISRGASIIYIRTGSNSRDYIYHVYPVSSTSGTVTVKDNTDKSITLSDGTVLEKSALATMDLTTTNLAIGGTYTFVLDTHGHYISWNNTSYGQIAYYTGTCKYTGTGSNIWSSEYTWAAQFVNVETGEAIDVPVTTAWRNAHDSLDDAGYYDITNTDAPTAYSASSQPVYDKYVLKTPSVSFSNTKFTIDGVYLDGQSNQTIYVNPSNVTFVIATGVGDGLETETFNGVSALLERYASADGTTSINMKNMMITVSEGTDGYYNAVTVFAFPDYTAGGIVYFPKNVDEAAWRETENGFEYKGSYLNGTKTEPTITVETRRGIEAGFYTFKVDADGYWKIEKTTDSVVTNGTDVKVISDTTKAYLLQYNDTYYVLNDSTVIVDLRDATEEYLIENLEDLKDGADYNELNQAGITVAFTYSGSNVTVLYITDDSIDH